MNRDVDVGGVPTIIDFPTARDLLAHSTDVGEVKDVRDRAEALRQYVRARTKNLALQNDAAEVKIRAERRLGELLQETELHRGATTRSHDATAPPVKLAELGIRRWESHRYQRIAAIPEVVVERYFSQARDAHEDEEPADEPGSASGSTGRC